MIKKDTFDKEKFKKELESNVRMLFRRKLEEATPQQIYQAVAYSVKDDIIDNWIETHKAYEKQDKKMVYYMSMEFLMGRALGNNMINLLCYDDVRETLEELGLDLNLIEDQEPDAALGNGGLGRLAACFLDSIATLGLPGDGIGLNYHFGLFRQLLVDHKQKEVKNPWITNESWLVRQPVSFAVPYKNFTMHSTLYDIDVPGYNNGCNRLHLFDVDTVDESIVPSDSINFDKHQIQKNLTLFLYPDDSDRAGQLLRIYQQYFMVSNAAQLILDEAVSKGSNLHDLADYAVVQINDTHPSMIIPEFIRLLGERGIDFDEAAEIVSHVCAYTNHTILAEALEKWPIHYLEDIVPQLVPIIRKLDEKVKAKYPAENLAIIDSNNLVHMAHMDIHYGYSVNGVAYLHTEILKNTELNNFYRIYPEKFNNKTNGITFRRWLLHCDPEMTEFITSLIGPGFKKNAEELEKLGAYVNDEEVLKKLLAVKGTRKTELKNYLAKTQGIELDDNSIYDIQIKRLHEYKRQQMNALYVIHKYFEIKAGKKPARKITAIFGAKAAPAYIIAKDIIHLILCLQQLIANDPEVSPYLQVVMVENYNVTLAEKLIPAADIHEQISLASKEASGTSNMKFMLNGAVAIGTMDGANVEIVQEVGEENAFIFGLSAQEVINYENNGGYNPMDYFNNDQDIRKVLMQLINGTYAPEDPELFRPLYNSLLNTQSTAKADTYFILKDFRSYADAQARAMEAYKDKEKWAKMALKNTACCGKFSADRTIQEYVDDIWHLDQVVIPEKKVAPTKAAKTK